MTLTDTPIRLDFRSDTVTRPTTGMREAMAAAQVGDDVYGGDPTVSALETRLAALLRKDAGLFLPSGTMANLVAIVSHCQRGDEFLCATGAHLYQWEAGGAAVLGSVQPQPVPVDPDGTMAIKDLHASVKVDDPHFAITKLVTIENTFGGRVLPLAYMTQVVDFARERNLGTHLDGARLFNAALSLGSTVSCLAAGYHTVSVCLSKGLGAPLGTVLVGDQQLVSRARRLRKMLGGGMRQAGIVAAAGLYALDHHVDRLAEDHDNAQVLAKLLSEVDGLKVTPPQSNIVFVELSCELAAYLDQELQKVGIAVGFIPGGLMRWVTHLDVNRAAIEEAVAVIQRLSEDFAKDC